MKQGFADVPRMLAIPGQGGDGMADDPRMV